MNTQNIPCHYYNENASSWDLFRRNNAAVRLRRGASFRLRVCCALLSLIATGVIAQAATVFVSVGGDSPSFTPANITVAPGDTVSWVWQSVGFNHTVTSGSNGNPDGLFDSGVHKDPFTFSFTFPNEGTFPYFCRPHLDMGMVGSVTVKASGPAVAQPLNVSTRLRVQTGEGAMIGGFIVTGNAPKKVIIRAIGPSLAGIAGVLANPTVQLNGSAGAIASNDDWKSNQQAEIQATGIPPSNDLESAIVATLSPGAYTAVVAGKNQTTGVGLVEVYDLNQPADSKLANISTRGAVGTGSNVMIGGFILGNKNGAANVILRAIGPSLIQSGISGVLGDPTLELRDGNGALVRRNDNWKESQQAQIEATGIAPKNDPESALIAQLAPGAYTAILAGKNGTTGVALVELYQLQ